MIAAFVAGSPQTSLVVALILSATAVFGAGIPLARYLRIAAPPLLFLLVSTLSLVVSLDPGSSATGLSLRLAESEFHRIAQTCSRSVACLTALLFLALTTPLSDFISLLRRCRIPETLLDLMTLCYRTLFVLSEAVHDTMTAQSSRLGYTTLNASLRSLGGLISNLVVQVWQRSLALHSAAQARNNDGALRFLENRYVNSGQNISIAAVSGGALIAVTVLLS